MKIQVVIEATSIEEYTEAIQALAAGYTVAPNPIMAEVLVDAKSVKKADEIKVAEEKPKTTRKPATKPVKAPKEEKNTTEPEAEKQTENAPSEAPKQESTVSFVDVKLKAKQLANLPGGKEDIKFILDKLGAKKLSDLTEDQYATFMEMAIEGEDNINTATEFSKNMDKVVPKEDAPTDDVSESNGKAEDKVETKEVTLEMIRSKAKELSVAGYKEDIKAALKDIGATALTKIPKDQYAAFYATMGEI